MASLSTHVLDAARGEPAAGVQVQLLTAGPITPGPITPGPSSPGSSTPPSTEVIGGGETDADGRIVGLAAAELAPGVYRLVFATGPYFAAAGVSSFYPEVSITFTVEEDRHYHVPLLLSPYAFSTYRGS